MTIAMGEGEAEIHQEQENTLKQGKDPDSERKNFKEILDGDATKFECNLCRKKFKRAIGAKTHIRSQHIKKTSERTLEKRTSRTSKKRIKPKQEDQDQGSRIQKLSVEQEKTKMKDKMKMVEIPPY